MRKALTGLASLLAPSTSCLKSRRKFTSPTDYDPVKPTGVLVAEADLEAHGIQDLADQIPAITTAADWDRSEV